MPLPEKPKKLDHSQLQKLTEMHKNYYDQNERKDFEKARRFFSGNFWSGAAQATETRSSLLASKNIIYAIGDTAISSLLGPNPQCAAVPRNPAAMKMAPHINGLMEYLFDTNRMRRRSAIAMTDAVLCSRGVFKTSWSKAEDRPLVRALNPSSVFFDLSVRDSDDIRYWLEATAIPWSEFKKRVEAGRYDIPISDVTPDRYPRWMSPDGDLNDASKTLSMSKWVTVWEYYDRTNGKVCHFVEGPNRIVFEGKLSYIPYTMFSLNHNGVDCSGLSEVQLILDQQQCINDLLTHWKKVTYMQIPRIGYDANKITNDNLDEVMASASGAFVPINVETDEPTRGLGSLFFPFPTPELPVSVKEFVARQEDDAAFISALAEAARGRMTGARTATEVAVVEAQMRTRLATREGHVHEALEDVARKMFFLSQKYMQFDKIVRLAGTEEWAAVGLEQLRDIEIDFKMISYNPIRQNPAIMAESLIQMMPLFQGNPHIDQRVLIESVTEALALPRNVLKPLEVVKQEMQAQQAEAEQAALGGAAAGQPALDAMLMEAAAAGQPVEAAPGSGVAPAEETVVVGGEVMAPAPGDVLPAGGGSPARGL